MSSPILNLSRELLLCIADFVDSEEDLSAFSRVNRTTLDLLQPYLLPHNIKHSGSSALLWACQQGHYGLAKQLLDLGADVNTTLFQKITWYETDFSSLDEWGIYGMRKIAKSKLVDSGYTPLILAVENQQEDIVKALLAVDTIQPDTKTLRWEGNREDGREDRTALSIAAERGYLLIVEMLLATRRVDVISRSLEDYTPLSYAALFGNWGVFRALVRYGGFDGSDLTNGEMCYAVSAGHVDVVKTLLARGADPAGESYVVERTGNQRGYATPLLIALMSRNHILVEILLNTNSIDLFRENGRCEGPFEMAAKIGDLDSFEKLVVAVDGKLPKQSGTLSLLYAAKQGHPDIVEILLCLGVDPNGCNNPGSRADFEASWTPLLAATKWTCDVQVIEMLLRAGADPRRQVISWKGEVVGQPPLNWLVQNLGVSGMSETDVVRLVRWMIECGADPDVASGNERMTLLHYAAKNGWARLAHLLVNLKGIVHDRQNYIGYTPLAIAVQSGHSEVVKLLLQTGEVNPHLTTCSDRTVLDLVGRSASPEKAAIEQLLRTYIERN